MAATYTQTGSTAATVFGTGVGTLLQSFSHPIAGERRFICTQGPLRHTVDDFWSLIMQEKIDAIVMLCDTIELGRPKCHQYWPEDATTVSLCLIFNWKPLNSPFFLQVTTSADGNLTINHVNQENLDSHLFKTRLQLTSANPKNQLIVRHFHWRKWPDRGVPVNHLAALRLLHYLGPYKRVLVHCSAGWFSSLLALFKHQFCPTLVRYRPDRDHCCDLLGPEHDARRTNA
jgi:protein tyrosine phosphatase